jgi:uncharacterized protein
MRQSFLGSLGQICQKKIKQLSPMSEKKSEREERAKLLGFNTDGFTEYMWTMFETKPFDSIDSINEFKRWSEELEKSEERTTKKKVHGETTDDFSLPNETPVLPDDNSKRFVSPDELREKSIALAKVIWESKFRPTFIIGLWRGGAAPALYVQELLAYLGCKADHVPIKTSSYVGETQNKEIKVYGLSYIVERANVDDCLLFVDDIFQSGRTIQEVLLQLKQQMRANFPKDIRVATLFVKKGKNETDITPNYFLEETSQWVVFPHELEVLSLKEIMTHWKFNPLAPLEPKE